jgi:hypothetical protein
MSHLTKVVLTGKSICARVELGRNRVGLSAMFLLASVLTGIPAKVIPGAIQGGLGAMLYWQNAMG